MEELKKLKRIRGGLKASLTVLCKDLTEFKKGASAHELEAKQVTIRNTMTKLSNNNERIYDQLDEENLQEAMVEDIKYEEEINAILANLSHSNHSKKGNQGSTL